MTFNQLLHVRTIAELGNMTLAASALYMTQPALTKSIKALETELGVQLFDRDTQPIRLTSAGEVFLEKGKQILLLHNELLDDMKRIAQDSCEKITIGMPGEQGSIWFPVLLSEVRQVFPHLEIRMAEGNSRTLENLILERNVDLALYSLPIFRPEIASTVLARESIVFAVSVTHPLTKWIDLSRNSPWTPQLLSPQLLKNETFVALTEGSGLRRLLNAAFVRHHLHPVIAMELQRNETAVRLAAEGVGIVLTPVKTAVRLNLEQKLAFFTLDDPVISRSMVAAYRKDTPPSPMLQKIIDIARKTACENPTLVDRVRQVIPPPQQTG